METLDLKTVSRYAMFSQSNHANCLLIQ